MLLVVGSRSYFVVDFCTPLCVVAMGLPTVSKAAMFPRPARMRTIRVCHASVCFLLSYVNVFETGRILFFSVRLCIVFFHGFTLKCLFGRSPLLHRCLLCPWNVWQSSLMPRSALVPRGRSLVCCISFVVLTPPCYLI